MMKQHGTRRLVETQIISSQNNGTPIIFSSLRNAKTERKKEKKKRVKQAKNIFHKLLTSCYLLLAMEDLSIATIYSNDSPLWRGT